MSQTILLVEDNEDDAFFMTRALKNAGIGNPLRVVEDGQEVVDYLAGQGTYADRASSPLPMIVFLDLKLPFKSGHEVLEWIRRQPALEKLVVIILSSSNEPIDVERAQRLGANSYLVKPPTPARLLDIVNSFALDWVRRANPV